MNSWFTASILVLLVLAYPLARSWARTRNLELEKSFRALAHKFDGALIDRNGSAARFRLDNDRVLEVRFVTAGRKPSRLFFEMKAILGSLKGRSFRLDASGPFRWLDRVSGESKCVTADAVFDSNFSSICDNPRWLLKVLNADVRAALLEFVKGSASYQVDYSDGVLTLLNQAPNRTFGVLESNFKAGKSVVNALTLTLEANRASV